MFSTNPIHNYRNAWLALLSGGLLTMSFPSVGFDLLAWIALVPLLITLKSNNFVGAFRLGLLTGFCHYITLLYWVTHTMKTYGHLPWYLSIGILCLFALYLSLYIGLYTALLTRCARHPAMLILAVPALWVSVEFLRTTLLSGFPWEILGASQFNRLPLIQISDLLGSYGISFLIALANGVLLLILFNVLKKKWFDTGISKWLAASAAGLFAVAFLLTWFYGVWRINSMDRLTPSAPHIRIAVAQGNIPQDLKWNPGVKVRTVKKYLDLSHAAKSENPHLIVWPESAAPFYFPHNRPLADFLVKGIENKKTHFLIGIPALAQGKDKTDYFNSAFLFGPEGHVIGKYDKAHLVPFGEYVPFRQWLPFIGKMVAQVGDFTAGKKGKTIQWGHTPLGTLICYELIFPYLSRALTKNGAALLVNITNDAWYGRTSAPYQHFSMAVFRAVENRRALVRSANTGISGFIDPVGRVLGQTPLFEEAVMTRNLPLIQSISFYTQYGDLFAIACIVLSLGLIIITVVISKKSKSNTGRDGGRNIVDV